MQRRTWSILGSAAALVLAACMHEPAPRPRVNVGLRYRLDAHDGWSGDGTQRVTAILAGAVATVDLQSPEARIVLTIDNDTAGILRVRLYPQVEGEKNSALGEVRHQRLDGKNLEGSPGYAPFLPSQPVEVGPGERALFYVDCPLGREASIGEYAVLLLEVSAESGKSERRLLPLVAAYSAARRAR